MPIINFPSIRNQIFAERRNVILHHFQKAALNADVTLISVTPFVIQYGDEQILITNKPDDQLIDEFDRVVLAGRKPTKKDIITGNLKLSHWLKHPLITTVSPKEVIDHGRIDSFF